MMETQELVVPKSIPITGPLTLELYDLITIVDRVAFYSMNQKKKKFDQGRCWEGDKVVDNSMGGKWIGSGSSNELERLLAWLALKIEF